MKKLLPLFTVTVFILFFSSHLFADPDSDSFESRVSSIEKRLNEIESLYADRVALLDKRENVALGNIQNRSDQLDVKFENLKTDQAKDFTKIAAGYHENVRNMGIFVTFCLIALGAGLFGAVKYFSKEKAIKILANKFEVNAENLSDLLKEVKKDYELKQTKKILVVTPDYGDDRFLSDQRHL